MSVELVADNGRIDVSVTELMQFRSCRRRWHLQAVERYEPNAPAYALEFGIGMHRALEYFYANKRDLAGAHGVLMEWHNTLDGDAITINDVEALNEFDRLHELGHTMLDNYVKFDEMAHVPLGRILAVEGVPLRGHVTRLKTMAQDAAQGVPRGARVQRHPTGRMLVPILDPATRKPLPGTPMLSARLDLLTERKTPALGLWVVDHKTLGQAPSDRGLDFDDQVTGYDYVVWRWLGVIPRGTIYNALIKEEPKPPRILQNGTLSTAKDQLTTPDLYREALKEHGLMGRSSKRIESEKHAACLDALLARGWDPFFMRHEPTRNEEELLAYEMHLFDAYKDLQLAMDDPKFQYPNKSIYNCPGCPVNKLCLAMEDGSDVDYVAETQYRIGRDRKAER